MIYDVDPAYWKELQEIAKQNNQRIGKHIYTTHPHHILYDSPKKLNFSQKTRLQNRLHDGDRKHISPNLTEICEIGSGLTLHNLALVASLKTRCPNTYLLTVTNSNGTTSLGGGGGGISRVGIDFATGHVLIGKILCTSSFWLNKAGNPSGNGTCKKYNSGGTLTDTYDNTKDWSTLTGSFVKTQFSSAAGVTVSNGDRIVIGDGTFSNGNEVGVEADDSGGETNTTYVFYNGSWNQLALRDCHFEATYE